MPLGSIYKSVQADLKKVDRQILAVREVDAPEHREMLEHALKIAGKRVRPALTLLAGRCFDYNPEVLLPMAAAVELMHTATLVHDDAIDKSAIRRSRDTVYRVWGEEKAVLLGDYIFARAGELATATGNLRAVKLFTRTLGIISTGEIIQSFAAFRLDQDRREYFRRIAFKTASLFVLSTEAGAFLCGAPEKAIDALSKYGHNTGVAFQIIDDVLDFTSTAAEMGKPIGSDLTQGTLTLPAIMSLERYPNDNPVRRLFVNQDALSEDEKGELVGQALEMVRNSPIVAECLALADDYSRRAVADLKELPQNQGRQALEALAEFLTERRT